MITNGFTYVAVLLFMAGVLVTLEKTARGTLAKFFKYVPSVVLCYLIAMLLCTLKVWDRDKVETPEEKQEMYLRAFQADYYLSSANAITEDGVIVNIDGNGNRVAAITWGPQHVIFVVGMNKVAQDPEAALKRARSTAAPINAARFDIQTPCQLDGQCHNCNSPQSICNYIHFLRNSSKPGRIIVILVGENLGY